MVTDDDRKSTARYPTLYLLHGRGDSMTAWIQEKADLDQLIRTGKIPPVIVAMPDAPWADRGSRYVDSQGSLGPGNRRLLDGRGRCPALRAGPPGPVRRRPGTQPGCVQPLPPSDSSVRDYGAFGVADQRFVDARYEQLNYTALLPNVNPDPADATHDLDFEEAVVYNKLVRTPGVTADWRVLGGGHDWDVWQPGFVDGVQNIFRYIGPAKPEVMDAPLIGTAGDDGVDAFAESNLFLSSDGRWVSGVTYGNTSTRNHGGADVFVNSLA